METIKNIIAEKGEDCKVDIDMLEDGLSKLPTAAYIELYRKMQARLYSYPNFGGCCGTIGESKPDIEVEVDYSEVDAVREKIDELGEKLDEVNNLLSNITNGKVSVFVDFSEIRKAASEYQMKTGKSCFGE